jgi:peptidoglycan hydrolase-like protein with peptidoglycan-binding domain
MAEFAGKGLSLTAGGIDGISSIACATKVDLLGPLQAHERAGFARRYNGPNYAATNYDGLLQQFYVRRAQGPLADLNVRTAPIHLMYRGFRFGSVEGVRGAATLRAIKDFQHSVRLPQKEAVDDGLLDALVN